jgi:RimJ/RimL family protein N-acetyltransferase
VLRLVVVDPASGVLSGGGTMHHHDPERRTIEIGYWLLPRARGHGIATNVARALADYAFTLGVRRVRARVIVGNVASERVLERAGFTREDVIRSTSGVEKAVYALRRPA